MVFGYTNLGYHTQYIDCEIFMLSGHHDQSKLLYIIVYSYAYDLW